MTGFITNGLPSLGVVSGLEEFPADSNAANGGQPQQEKVSIYKLALMLYTMLNSLSKTPVAATIYYTQYNIGFTYTPTPRGSTISEQSFSVTGMNVPVGGTGGTDTLHVGVYNSAGLLVARSILAGVTLGTALTIQQVPLYQTDGVTIGPVTLTSGVYYLAVQLSGTTGRFQTVNSPVWPVVTGSQTGVSGVLATITPPATYTANLGPMVSLY